MSDLFNEVNEELRREKLDKFWAENKGFILSCIVAAILGTAIATYWKNMRFDKAQDATAAYYDAFKTDDLDQILSYTASAKGDHAAMAKLSTASLLFTRGKEDEGLKMLQSLQSDGDVEKIYRDLAVLAEASQTLGNADPKMLEEKLIPLSNTQSIWHLTAKEFLAILAAQQEDYAKALDLLSAMEKSPNISDAMIERVTKLRTLYTSKKALQSNAVKKQETSE